MAQVEIISEKQSQAGWRFTAQVLDENGELTRHAIGLSWADYNLWSPDGSDLPADIAEAVMLFLLTRMPPEQLPDSLDASIARRYYSDADSEIPRFIP